MKTVYLNGEPLDVSAPDQRALAILVAHDFAASPSLFEEGPRKWSRYILPGGQHADRLGIRRVDSEFDIVRLDPAAQRRARRYFDRHPRRRVCVIGTPRRVNLILHKLRRA